jgi:hypothetical protein
MTANDEQRGDIIREAHRLHEKIMIDIVQQISDSVVKPQPTHWMPLPAAPGAEPRAATPQPVSHGAIPCRISSVAGIPATEQIQSVNVATPQPAHGAGEVERVARAISSHMDACNLWEDLRGNEPAVLGGICAGLAKAAIAALARPKVSEDEVVNIMWPEISAGQNADFDSIQAAEDAYRALLKAGIIAGDGGADV